MLARCRTSLEIFYTQERTFRSFYGLPTSSQRTFSRIGLVQP